jgi:uncharacterized LabA/DUF88 family protein
MLAAVIGGLLCPDSNRRIIQPVTVRLPPFKDDLRKGSEWNPTSLRAARPVAAILAELAKYGTANIRRSYGDWGSAALKGWKSKLHEFAIRPIQQFSYSTGKNATDIALVIDAMELLYTQRFDAFCIASSDADFTPLIMQLKANGHDVYGFGERKTPLPFVNACTTFLYLDSLDGGRERRKTTGTNRSPQLWREKLPWAF